MRISTTLSEDRKRQFGQNLALQIREARRKNPSVGRTIAAELGWPNLSRISDYVSGKHFPAPKTLMIIAMHLGKSAVFVLLEAGYHREILPMLFALSRSRDGRSKQDHEAARLTAVSFAVFSFQRRGETVQEGFAYGAALQASVLDSRAPRAQAALHRTERLDPLLATAREALGNTALSSETRMCVAAEYVREWARGIDAQVTKEAEDRYYARPPMPPPWRPRGAMTDNQESSPFTAATRATSRAASSKASV